MIKFCWHTSSQLLLVLLVRGVTVVELPLLSRDLSEILILIFKILLIITAPPVVDSVSCSHVLSAHLTLGWVSNAQCWPDIIWSARVTHHSIAAELLSLIRLLWLRDGRDYDGMIHNLVSPSLPIWLATDTSVANNSGTILETKIFVLRGATRTTEIFL